MLQTGSNGEFEGLNDFQSNIALTLLFHIPYSLSIKWPLWRIRSVEARKRG